MRVVATVIALVLLASNVYGDRESAGGGDNKLPAISQRHHNQRSHNTKLFAT
jgi:hypothetical protein